MITKSLSFRSSESVTGFKCARLAGKLFVAVGCGLLLNSPCFAMDKGTGKLGSATFSNADFFNNLYSNMGNSSSNEDTHADEDNKGESEHVASSDESGSDSDSDSESGDERVAGSDSSHGSDSDSAIASDSDDEKNDSVQAQETVQTQGTAQDVVHQFQNVVAETKLDESGVTSTCQNINAMSASAMPAAQMPVKSALKRSGIASKTERHIQFDAKTKAEESTIDDFLFDPLTVNPYQLAEFQSRHEKLMLKNIKPSKVRQAWRDYYSVYLNEIKAPSQKSFSNMVAAREALLKALKELDALQDYQAQVSEIYGDEVRIKESYSEEALAAIQDSLDDMIHSVEEYQSKVGYHREESQYFAREFDRLTKGYTDKDHTDQEAHHEKLTALAQDLFQMQKKAKEAKNKILAERKAALEDKQATLESAQSFEKAGRQTEGKNLRKKLKADFQEFEAKYKKWEAKHQARLDEINQKKREINVEIRKADFERQAIAQRGDETQVVALHNNLEEEFKGQPAQAQSQLVVLAKQSRSAEKRDLKKLKAKVKYELLVKKNADPVQDKFEEILMGLLQQKKSEAKVNQYKERDRQAKIQEAARLRAQAEQQAIDNSPEAIAARVAQLKEADYQAKVQAAARIKAQTEWEAAAERVAEMKAADRRAKEKAAALLRGEKQ